jgi:hypothetical protein
MEIVDVFVEYPSRLIITERATLSVLDMVK